MVEAARGVSGRGGGFEVGGCQRKVGVGGGCGWGAVRGAGGDVV